MSKVKIPGLLVHRRKGHRPEGLHLDILVGHMHEKREAARAERRRGLFKEHVLNDALKRQRLRLSVVGVLQHGVADRFLSVQRDAGRGAGRGIAAEIGAVDAPGKVQRSRISGVIGDAFLAYRRDIHIDALKFSGVYGGEQDKLTFRPFLFRNVGDRAVGCLRDGVFGIAAHVVFFDLQIGLDLLLPGGVRAPCRVSRDPQRKDQCRGEHDAEKTFLFHAYDPFRAFLHRPGSIDRGFTDKPVVQTAQRLSDGFPFHTSNPSLIR